MERLTRRTDGVVVYVGAHNKDAVGQTPFEVSSRGIREILARLAEYEDTGLTPENCAEYRKFEDEIIASGKTFGRLIELLKADKEGRVVALPCKVGGTVINQTFAENPALMKNTRLEIAYESRCGVIFHMGYGIFADLVERGQIKPVSEEAEKALRRAENEKT